MAEEVDPQRLHLSERTVTTHVRNIPKKLGMSSCKEVSDRLDRQGTSEAGSA